MKVARHTFPPLHKGHRMCHRGDYSGGGPLQPNEFNLVLAISHSNHAHRVLVETTTVLRNPFPIQTKVGTKEKEKKKRVRILGAHFISFERSLNAFEIMCCSL